MDDAVAAFWEFHLHNAQLVGGSLRIIIGGGVMQEVEEERKDEDGIYIELDR